MNITSQSGSNSPSPIIKTSPLRQQQLNQFNPSTTTPTKPKPKTTTTPTTTTTPINKLNSPNSTPRSAENHDQHQRRSFQGDHHRHRYMTYSSTTTPSPNSLQNNNNNNNNNNNHHQSREKHLLLLGAPPNAHYSPHYGSSQNQTTSAQRAPTSKRKPAPPLSPSYPPTSPILDSLTPRTPSPSHSHSSYLHSPEISPSRRTHRKLIKSRSPSPSPRSGSAIVKKIGSALVAPFRNSNSRRGSDASEIGLSIQEVSRLSSLGPPVQQPQAPPASSAEHLPWMPSVGARSPTPGAKDEEEEDHGLTEAERIVRASRSRGTLAEPSGAFPERVLRVVNGSASVSTRASGQSGTSDLLALEQSCNTTQPLNILPSQNSRHSYLSTSTKAGCTKCMALEDQLRAEVARARALERALDAQTLKLDQLRNWATAKVSSLDQTLQAQEKLLQQVEQRMAERHQPDIKSDYLIALQKDYVELNARLALLESKEQDQDEEDTSPLSQPSHTGRSTVPAYVSKLLEDRREVRPLHTRAYSTPPLATTTTTSSSKPRPDPVRYTSPFSRPSWKPASPATMASKLVPPPPTTPGSPNSRSAPVTPSSPSGRPRYTSALGIKAPSPLGFSYSSRSHIDGPEEDDARRTIRGTTTSPRPPLSSSRPTPISPSAASSLIPKPSSPRIPSPRNASKHNYARPTLASSSRFSSLNPPSSSDPSSPSLANRNLDRPQPLRTNNSPAARRPNTSPLNLNPRGNPIVKNKAVGDLIRLFDQPK